MADETQLLDATKAIILPQKLRDYLLHPSHRRGRTKAAFFAALGYTGANWALFADALKTEHLAFPARRLMTTEYGVKFAIERTITGTNGRKAMIRSLWMIRHEEDSPRFLTAYPIR